ncbi:hypothetical protein J2Y45_006834 [Dyadobacter sp. BE34]|uniref:Phosphate-selective porin O and P n=1 Tax=Dyadobacter fermentans TaxID=94254 RepID=A0ABU1RB24_9BACT|nr:MULTISPECIES: hypothetical protein [Dyadobacter]MDR6809785.1 hypothetical protein [Dyadobacter fermentans]MDR7047500.1 hypothetical protein [Dyadobacter sp. BE242]MDR7201670.1 hypothetical protein [Dyadobacter sp. BE34]MDR7219540.1 hypothetical protein [Dyadobacter sp. BE31]MDR7267337.1 hypothetical protein [Dyadobacter sp. BE32]
MRHFLFLIFLLYIPVCLHAQSDTSFFFSRVKQDSSKLKLNMDAVYDRPFLQMGKMPVALGGYLEANSSYFSSDGVSDGLSFQIPRLTVFMSATIRQRIKFMTEIEFEEGGKEVNIEFAALDIELHPLLNLRGGVIMNPIGSFNQNHDGPKWEFVDRPISSTTIIPSTWSNVGFGLFGKIARKNWVWAYEAYLSNGFNDQIIDNTENRTWFPAVKLNTDRFEESFNGTPLKTAKMAIRHRKIAELGVSWMNGVYNKFQNDGIRLDHKRYLNFLALDVNTTLRSKTIINGEWVWAWVDIPSTYSQQFGNRQQGGFIDIVQPIIKGRILGWSESVINVAGRGEYADYNIGSFAENNARIADHIYGASLALSFRPAPQTVIRANYRYQWQTDFLGNPATRTGGIQLGFSTYF